MRSLRLLAAAVFLAAAVPSAAVEYPRRENRAWSLGERLVFQIKFGPLSAGTAEMAVEDRVTLSGRSAYRIRSTARSADWFFYRVRDTVISYLDEGGLFSWKYEKHLREGQYRNDEVSTFRQQADTPVVVRVLNGARQEPMPIPRYAKDVLGALYYVRTMTLRPGESVEVPISDGRKNYDLRVTVDRRERVRTPAGTFDCVVVEPRLESEGIFVKKGRMWVWLTDDARHMPVRMKAEIPVGSIEAFLQSYTSGR